MASLKLAILYFANKPRKQQHNKHPDSESKTELQSLHGLLIQTC